MDFDFRHTCHEIDKEIESFQGYIEEKIPSFADAIGLCYFTEEMGAEEVKTLNIDTAKEILDTALDCFEVVRTLNTDMREAAESQLNDIQADKEAVEEELSEMTDRNDRLEDEIIEMQEKINDYDTDISSLREDLEYYKDLVEKGEKA